MTETKTCECGAAADVFAEKYGPAASKGWRRLKGANQLPSVINGIKFTDGVAEIDAENRAA